MPRPRNEKQAEEMIRLYGLGYSLSQIGAALNSSRQNVYKILKLRKVQLRTVAPAPYVEWNGRKFSIRENGYYAETTELRQYLHRCIWEAANGPIPEGFDVHHRDENKTNNDLSNLEMLTYSEHSLLHRDYERRRK